ncbi:MAG: hypothetical protein M3544_09660 [Pseudomonadota bacterium]|nr:hypothetical protein [Pseudomonadota bacterium]
MLKLDELETALQSPIVTGKAEMLAVSIARSAPSGPIANLAMQVMSAAIDRRAGSARDADGSLAKTLSELRTALKAAQTAP